MMFASVYKRVSQYGITENRYYLIALGLWITGIMLYFSFKKPVKNTIIPISLSIIIIISVFGPVSSFAISKSSQNKRLEKILNNNNMIKDEEVVPNDLVALNDKKEINNIITYFNENHKLEELKYFPEGFNLDQSEKITGFKYEELYYYMEEEDQINYGVYNIDEIIDIKEYDYFINLNNWDISEKNLDGLIVKYDIEKDIVIFSENEKLLEKLDIKKFIKDIHEKHKRNELNIEDNYDIDPKDVTYEEILIDEENKIKIKFILNNVNGEIEDDHLKINNIDFILLVKKV